MRYELKTNNKRDIQVETNLSIVMNGNTLAFENIRVDFVYSNIFMKEELTEINVDILLEEEEYNNNIYRTTYYLTESFETQISLDDNRRVIKVSYSHQDKTIKVML